MDKLIVAIDGPSGVGKSTLSRLLAKKLNYINIDTGAMYRAVALAARRKQIDLDDSSAVQDLLRDIDVKFSQTSTGSRVLLDGEDVSDAIRTPEVSQLTPAVAAIAAVRQAMVTRQREMGAEGGVVLEGRDIGTVVFPQAEVKLFMIASAEERGRRRYEELRLKGHDVDLQQTIHEVEERDRADRERQHSPLLKAADAIEIDTTGLTIEQVLDAMQTAVSLKQGRAVE